MSSSSLIGDVTLRGQPLFKSVPYGRYFLMGDVSSGRCIVGLPFGRPLHVYLIWEFSCYERCPIMGGDMTGVPMFNR